MPVWRRRRDRDPGAPTYYVPEQMSFGEAVARANAGAIKGTTISLAWGAPYLFTAPLVATCPDLLIRGRQPAVPNVNGVVTPAIYFLDTLADGQAAISSSAGLRFESVRVWGLGAPAAGATATVARISGNLGNSIHNTEFVIGASSPSTGLYSCLEITGGVTYAGNVMFLTAGGITNGQNRVLVRVTGGQLSGFWNQFMPQASIQNALRLEGGICRNFYHRLESSQLLGNAVEITAAAATYVTSSSGTIGNAAGGTVDFRGLATATVPGHLALGGDFGGTATAPKVAKLTGGVAAPAAPTDPGSEGQYAATATAFFYYTAGRWRRLTWDAEPW